jgi:LmbE family N-acetylglucosaminyl deacetylase
MHATHLGLPLCALLGMLAGSTAAWPADEAAGQGAYHFATGYSTARQLAMQPATEGMQLHWPDLARLHWDTALLGVRSERAQAEPWVEVSAGTATIRQYLDANAAGIRWLNLSALHDQLAAGSELVLRTHDVTLAPEPATLQLFSNDLDLRGTILVIAPHPDDAEIAAFGLYADRKATIVTLTAGNAGDMNYRALIADPASHYLMKGYLRAVDSVTVPWQGGIPPQRTYNLGYFDGLLDSMYKSPQQVFPEVYGPNSDVAPYRRANLGTLLPRSSRQNTWNNLLDDLVTILRKVHPAIIVMPDPRLDHHADHQYAAVAVVAALARTRGSATFLLYTNHAGGDRYPYGPAGTVMSLPPISAELSMQRVYSHPTNAALQTRKLFALESMHDLRLAPDEQAHCGLPDAALRPDYPRAPQVDYFRRAPRANELFYVFDSAGMRALVAGFLRH